jgi:hypothetical protein
LRKPIAATTPNPSPTKTCNLTLQNNVITGFAMAKFIHCFVNLFKGLTLQHLKPEQSVRIGFLIHRDTLQFPEIQIPSTPEGILSKSVDYPVWVRPTLQFRNLNCLGFTGTSVKKLTFLERSIAPLIKYFNFSRKCSIGQLRDIESLS